MTPWNEYQEKKLKKRDILLINLQCLPAHPSLSDSGPMSLPTHLPNSYLSKEPPPRATESMSSMTLPLRGPLANSSGSPHLGNMMHPPMPPSCIMEELQRAFASKNRQERWVLRWICLNKLPHSLSLTPPAASNINPYTSPSFSCVPSVSTKGVSRAHPPGCGVLTDGSLAPVALRTNTHNHLSGAAAVWEVGGPTGPRRRRRRIRRTCGWTSASQTPQASPQTWKAGMNRSSLVGWRVWFTAVCSLYAFRHSHICCCGFGCIALIVLKMFSQKNSPKKRLYIHSKLPTQHQTADRQR